MPLYAIDDLAPTLPDDGSAWVAPSADVIGDVRLGRRVSVWFGATIRADNTPILIGDGSNVQEGAVLHSDPGSPLTIGAGATIGHSVVLHGCTVGDNALIGMGATILNGAVIGRDSLVGAGALVTEGKSFPDGSLIVGAPASAKRPLTPEEIAGIGHSAEGYRLRSAHYARTLREIAPG